MTSEFALKQFNLEFCSDNIIFEYLQSYNPKFSFNNKKTDTHAIA